MRRGCQLIAPAPVLSLVVLAAGCGGGDETAEASAAATTGGEPTEAQPTEDGTEAAFPVTIPPAVGETTIETAPERVVT